MTGKFNIQLKDSILYAFARLVDTEIPATGETTKGDPNHRCHLDCLGHMGKMRKATDELQSGTTRQLEWADGVLYPKTNPDRD